MTDETSSPKYQVETFRTAGLDARWTKTEGGTPIIAVRNQNSKLDHQRKFWYVDRDMWKEMLRFGIIEGFDHITLLGDIFSIDRITPPQESTP